MKARKAFHNRIVAALFGLLVTTAPIFAQSVALDGLFDKLKAADEAQAARLETEIWREWSKSGSPAFDLLLERGREAMAQGDLEVAVEHLTALTDHAPDFAEGWNARATAYFQLGEYGPSVADIQKTLALNPRHFGALAGFGMILEELGRDEQARDVYGMALAIHPHLTNVIDAIARLDKAAGGAEL